MLWAAQKIAHKFMESVEVKQQKEVSLQQDYGMLGVVNPAVKWGPLGSTQSGFVELGQVEA